MNTQDRLLTGRSLKLQGMLPLYPVPGMASCIPAAQAGQGPRSTHAGIKERHHGALRLTVMVLVRLAKQEAALCRACARIITTPPPLLLTAKGHPACPDSDTMLQNSCYAARSGTSSTSGW